MGTECNHSIIVYGQRHNNAQPPRLSVTERDLEFQIEFITEARRVRNQSNTETNCAERREYANR